jgi:hypothetical protein
MMSPWGNRVVGSWRIFAGGRSPVFSGASTVVSDNDGSSGGVVTTGGREMREVRRIAMAMDVGPVEVGAIAESRENEEGSASRTGEGGKSGGVMPGIGGVIPWLAGVISGRDDTLFGEGNAEGIAGSDAVGGRTVVAPVLRTGEIVGTVIGGAAERTGAGGSGGTWASTSTTVCHSPL